MKSKKIIFVILILVQAASLSAYEPEQLVQELKFHPVPWKYEEGIRNVLSIYHILEDDNGVFWLGSINGFYRFNGNSAINFTTRINEKQGNLISSKWITAIDKDDDNRIWFGTTLGLFVLDQKTETVQAIPLENLERITADNSYISNIVIDGAKAYIGTRDGLYEVDTKSLDVVNSYLTNAAPHRDKGTMSTVLSILKDNSEQNIWFSTRLGLHRKSSKSRIVTFSVESKDKKNDHFSLQSIKLNREIYLADYRDGVVKFDIDSKSFKNYHIGDSEWSRAKSIVHLEQELFLVNAEGKGITIFDARTGQYHWLKSNRIIKASNFKLFKDSAGYIWFASNGELFRSNLSFASESDKKRTSLDLGNSFVNGKKMNNIMGQPSILHLDHKENNLQVNFSLTNKWIFKDVSYQYQLDKNDWINIIETNKLNLFDLSAGNHSLTIRARNNQATIAENSLQIRVHRPFTSSPLFYTLILLSFLGLLTGIYYYNKRQYEKAAKIKSKYEARLATLESQALRSQINPHFIFNTLNSIKYYSIEKSPEETGDFISSFSTLIRRILENSKKNLITLHEEIETLKNYTAIEALRFHERFDVEYRVDSNIETERFLIPPMIIQPFVENAIWHGLMHKSGNRKLNINFRQNGIGVVCEVIDNGIGRETSNSLKNNKSHKSSLGMKITQERMEIINARNMTNNSFEIKDLMDENGYASGTKASIYFLPKEDNNK